MINDPEAALQRAIEHAGGAAKLARELGVTVQAVTQWKRAPVRRAIAIEQAVGGKVTRAELCPEIFDNPESREMQKAS